MNENSKSDKALFQLGLPPMELAETNSNDRNRNNTRKCLPSPLQKILTILALILITMGSYIILVGIIQINDNKHTTEIIIVTGTRESPNQTSGQEGIDILVQFKNNTKYQAFKRKKRHALISNKNKEHGKISFKNWDDAKMRKAREIIMNHDMMCNEETHTEVCKEIVTKLKEITGNDANVPVKIKKDSDDTESDLSKDREQVDGVITSTEKSKRETRPIPNFHHLHEPFEAKDSYGYENPSYAPQSPHLAETCLLARILKQNLPNMPGAYNPSVPEYSPLHYENSHLPYVATALPSPFIQGREAETTRRKIHPQDVEIFMRFLTPSSGHFLVEEDDIFPYEFHRPEVSSKENVGNSTKREADCPSGTVACSNGETCIGERQWCDGNVDCGDISDESRCTCKSRVDKSRLCDGYFDCPFGEDEMGCFGCSEIDFSCEDLDVNSQSTCFTKEQRCNNVADCPNHKDEMDCTMLAPSLHKKPLFAVSNTEGFLHRNYKGNWHAVCQNPYMWAHDACRRETGLIIRPPFIQMVQIDPMLKVDYLNTGPGGLIQTSNTCFNSSAVYITCPDLLCGTRISPSAQHLIENAVAENHLFGRNKRFLLSGHPYPFMYYGGGRMKRHAINVTDSQGPPTGDTLSFHDKKFDGKQADDRDRNKRAESRVVGGRPSLPTAWPWMAAMYRDGTFHCGGVIITQSWILSAAHCVHKFWEHYYEIQVGMLRRFSFSPQEQNHRVSHIIVNQHYSQTDMKNDLSLLRVKPAIQFSRWVRPICLPGPDTAGSDWLWGPPAGTLCTAVGWGATVEHGPDPDHMREVEVPIWEKCKHREDRAGKEICAGLTAGGKDACQGDSGGPLLCQNPMNSQQWYMAGIVSHGDGCARKGEPGVYTRVSLYVKWIRYHIFSKSLPTIQPKQECPGFKCISGISKCLPNKRMCDKIIDCLDGEDEINCEAMRTTHAFGDIFLSALNTENRMTAEAEKDVDVFAKDTNETDSFQSNNTHNMHTTNDIDSKSLHMIPNASQTTEKTLVIESLDNGDVTNENRTDLEEKEQDTLYLKNEIIYSQDLDKTSNIGNITEKEAEEIQSNIKIENITPQSKNKGNEDVASETKTTTTNYLEENQKDTNEDYTESPSSRIVPENDPIDKDKFYDQELIKRSTWDMDTSPVDFSQTSTLETTNNENLEGRASSDEYVTTDPNRSTSNDIKDGASRGDMSSFSVTLSKESLESRSFVAFRRSMTDSY